MSKRKAHTHSMAKTIIFSFAHFLTNRPGMTQFHLSDNKTKRKNCVSYLFVKSFQDHCKCTMAEHLTGVVLELSDLLHLVS